MARSRRLHHFLPHLLHLLFLFVRMVHLDVGLTNQYIFWSALLTSVAGDNTVHTADDLMAFLTVGTATHEVVIDIQKGKFGLHIIKPSLKITSILEVGLTNY